MKKNLLKVIATGLVIAMFAGLLSGCSSSKDTSETSTGASSVASSASKEAATESSAPAKDSIIYVINGDPSCLEPTVLTDGASAAIWYQIYNTLLEKDAEGNLYPGLAKEWEFNEDGTELTLKLEEGVTFHNGDSFTSADVVYTLEKIYANPTLTSTVTNYDHAEAVDDYTVVIYYTAPFGAALNQLTGYSTNIVDAAYYEEVGEEGYNNAPVGTGAYKFVSRVAGEKIELAANENYFRGAPVIKNVTIRTITDPNSAATALMSGDVDLVQTPSVDLRDTLMNYSGITWDEAPSSTTVFLMINNSNPILSDVRVRQAIWYAIDKESLLEGSVEGLGQVLETLAPGSVPSAYDESFEGLGYDPDKAVELLKEAGYENGVTISVPMMDSDTYRKPTVILKDMLSAVGINLDIETYERASWISLISSGDYSMVVMTWGVPELDGDFYTRLLHNGSYLMIDPKEGIDDLLKAQQVELDPEARHEIFREINTIVRDNANLVPLYSNYNYIAYNSALKGVNANAASEYHIADMSW